MHLHLIRHGEHPPAFRGGWSQRGLTEQGHRQAAALAARLAREGWSVDTLISSDLPRAIETAHHVSQALGVSVISSEIWREVNNGLLAGMPNVEAEVRFPGLYWSTLRMDDISLHSFVFEADTWSITRRNDTAHLEGIAARPADPDTSAWNDFGERRKVKRRG